MMARLSASVRSVWTCGSSAPGNRQAHRLGAGRQQERVPGDLPAVRERQLAGRPDRSPPRAPRARARSSARRRRRAAAAASTPRARCRPGSPSTGWGDRRAATRRRRTAGSRRRSPRGAASRPPTRRPRRRPRWRWSAATTRAGCEPVRRAAPPTRIWPSATLDVVAGDGVQRRRAQHRAPVRRSKQAWCQGQRTVSPTTAPRRAGRRSGCRSRRRAKSSSPRRTSSTGLAAGVAEQRALGPERRSPGCRLRDRDPRASLRLHPCGVDR